jgi:hypothetical protein
MTTFAIDTDNNITAFAAANQAPEDQPRFATEKEFAKLCAEWPISRFADVWNAFAGVVPFDSLKPVKKFTDRKTAVNRIWKAIQALTPAPAHKAATGNNGTPAAREGSKKAIVLGMLKQPDGATLADIMAATGWQAHSVRGFISGSLTKKMGLKVESIKREDDARSYRIA